MNKIILSCCIAIFFLTVHVISVLAQESANNPRLLQLKGEVLEVEELKEPLGSAIYTVKDLSSGATIKFLADKNRSLVKIGGVTKSTGDVLGGSKVTIIYQKSPDQNLPEIVFAKVTNSYT